MYFYDKKFYVSVRLSEEDFKYLDVLSRRWGVPRSDVIRSIISRERIKEINSIYDSETN